VRRATWLLGITLASYAISLAAMGLAVGFDHGADRWLVAGAWAALAVGLAASVLVRVVILVGDPDGRAAWWTNASLISRGSRIAFFAARIAVVGIVWDLAIGALRR
jgi:hypothetical protein